MCTLTWLTHNQGYEVFFNRDEQRSRPKALLPHFVEDSRSIMPVDPQGGGTWIAVNQDGITLCLLNNYQAQKKHQKIGDNCREHSSRGLIIPSLIQCQDTLEIYSTLKDLDISAYLPFMLVIFSFNAKQKKTDIFLFNSDGLTLKQTLAEQPVISSAISLSEVKQQRSALFKQTINIDSQADDFISYHSSHIPDKGKFSVCMHRDDASTQSLSHLNISNEINFSYHDGSPCLNKKWSRVRMP